jgi:site-specific recombinase XerD
MAYRIDTVESRRKLKARPTIYWHRLSTGRHIGLRKLTSASDGTWIAQVYDGATRLQTRRSLGAFDDLPANQRFDAAKKAADEWFEHLDRGGTSDIISVRQACERYAAYVRDRKDAVRGEDIDARFKRWVYPGKIADIPLQKLIRAHVEEWRRAMEKTDVVVNPHAKTPTTRGRAKSTVNRDMAALRAALNHAHDHGAVTNDMAWRVALRPFKNADGRRDAYLDRGQRRALIEKSPADVARFLTGLSLMPLRPGALARLTVSSLDRRIGILTIGADKAGRDRRIKLPVTTAAFFAEQAKDKLPSAPLFARADGKAWDNHSWKKPIKAAVRAAELPDVTTAYAMRHSTITDLVTNGLDLLTIAQLSGTSVAMIEKHYGHHRQDHAAAALAELAL